LSIFKVVNYKHDDLNHLQDRLTYIRRIEATRRRFTYGVAVSESNPFSSMNMVKEAYHKTNGKTHFHYILSPEKEDFENLLLDEFMEVSIEVASLIGHFGGDFQVVSTIHLDSSIPHIHIIANNIDYKTGLRFSLSKWILNDLKETINFILSKYGISKILGYEIVDGDEEDLRSIMENYSWKK